MSFSITDLSCDPAQPQADQPFRLTVELDRNAASEEKVSVEKQRIVKNAGGFLELRPTGPNYFKLDPQPITVHAGAKRGTSGPIVVRRDAKAQPGEPPVRFPEHLLFTGFGKPDGFQCEVVPILAEEKAGIRRA